MSHQKKNEEQTDIEIMKSRKMIELIEKAVSRKKDEIIRQQQIAQRKTDREFLSSYIYKEKKLWILQKLSFLSKQE
jgi:hypothetical protein